MFNRLYWLIFSCDDSQINTENIPSSLRSLSSPYLLPKGNHCPLHHHGFLGLNVICMGSNNTYSFVSSFFHSLCLWDPAMVCEAAILFFLFVVYLSIV